MIYYVIEWLCRTESFCTRKKLQLLIIDSHRKCRWAQLRQEERQIAFLGSRWNWEDGYNRGNNKRAEFFQTSVGKNCTQGWVWRLKLQLCCSLKCENVVLCCRKVMLKCSSHDGHSIICKNPFFSLIRGPRTVIGQKFGVVMANANTALCGLDEQLEGK